MKKLSVIIQGRKVLAVRRPRRFSLPVEHVVGADIHHFAAERFAGFGKVFRAGHIDRVNLVFVFRVLGGVYRRPRGTVNHRVGLDLVQDPSDRGLIGNIQLYVGAVCDIRADSFMSAALQLLHHIIAELTADAGNKYLHGFFPSSFLICVVLISGVRGRYTTSTPSSFKKSKCPFQSSPITKVSIWYSRTSLIF